MSGMVWNYEDGLSSLWSHVLVFWQQQCSVRITSVHHRKWSIAISHFWLFLVRLLKSGSLEVIVAARRNLVHFLKDFSFPSIHWVLSFCNFSSLHIFMFLLLSEFMHMPFLLWSSVYLDWSFSLPLSIKMLWVKLIQLLGGWEMEINLIFCFKGRCLYNENGKRKGLFRNIANIVVL